MSDPNSPAPSLPPAGWYPHPGQYGAELYWDGSRWTSESRPIPARDTSAPDAAVPAYGTPSAPAAVPPHASTPSPLQPYGSSGFESASSTPVTRNNFAIAALVLGVVSCVINPLYAPSILAIIFGIRGQRIGATTGVGKTMARVGYILGIVGAALALLTSLVLRFAD